MAQESHEVSGRLPRVAIVGRQNVGKSTLLNRILGSREAIAHRDPGVTRDRLEATAEWRGRPFVVVDTGGFVSGARGIDAAVTAQAERAVGDADVIVLVADAVTGVQDEDAALARRLRGSPVPVIVVANKVDADAQEPGAADLFALGLGEPVPVSALHGRGSGELLDRLVALFPEEGRAASVGAVPAFAIVGRPNVGKSSIFNRLVGEERTVVAPEAGTTRDAVDSVVEWEGRAIRFVDTAGFRKRSRTEGVEFYGSTRAVRAIDRSDVVALVVDATEGVTGEDRRLASRVVEAGRGLVGVANKWDLVPPAERTTRFEDLRERLEVFPGVPLLRTSALTGQGIQRVVPALLRVREEWTKRVPTAAVNRLIQRAQGQHPPPRAAGKLLYGTQAGASPPRFVIFSTGRVPRGYGRFLENRIRADFGFEGAPIHLSFRRRKRGR